MKKIIHYIKNTSLGMQLLSVFAAIGIIIGSLMVITFSLNYTTMENHSQYLQYISMMSKLSEEIDGSKKVINQMMYTMSGDEKQQMSNHAKEVKELIATIRDKTTSVDIKLRLRVTAYLVEQYEEKARLLSETLAHEQYLEVIEILNRIDIYIQEMISCSVKENEALLQASLKKNKMLQYSLMTIAFGIVGMIMYLCLRYSRYLEELIGNILALTKRVAKGNKSEVLQIQEGPEEIREIIASFNGLIRTMEQLNQKADEKAQLELKLAEEKLARSHMNELLKEAQLQGLQFQIQPHFLFNTLNVISMMAIMEDNRKVYDLIMALSGFMRYSLKKTTALVSLDEELDMAQKYLYILKARLGSKLEYEVRSEIQEEIEVPPFILQPIVENAFRHGLEEKMGKGKIVVRITRRREYVILRVFNDGIGMEKEKLAALRKQCRPQTVRMDQEQHIGIQNVVYRLNMLFNDKVNYKIYSSVRRGTLFTIEILS